MEWAKSTETTGAAHVTISARGAAPLPPTSAKPQIFVLTLLLHRIAFMGLLAIIRIQMGKENQTAFEINGNRVFMIIAIVALFVVEFVSAILLCTNIHLHTYYTFLMFIGSFSAFLAPFSLVMVLVLPLERNWIGYLLMCLIFGIIVSCFCFDDVQQDKRSRVPTFSYLGLVLVPLSLMLVLSLPQNLNWVVYSVIYLSLGMENVYTSLPLAPSLLMKKNEKRAKLGSSPSDQQN